MKWSDLPLKPTTKALRQFAAAWLVFFLAFGAQQYFMRGHQTLGLVVMGLAVMVGVLGLIQPAAVRGIFVAWMVLAFPIGWMISQAMLLLMFYVILTPVALFFRLRDRDLLQRKPPADCVSFWVFKDTPQDLRRYLRQY
jgi:hypothetical protein